MHKTIMKEILAALLAFLICFSVLPAGAQAADPVAVSDVDVRSINVADRGKPDTAKGYYTRAAAEPDGAITIYIPVKNYGTATVTDLECRLPVSEDTESFPFVVTTKPEMSATLGTHWSDANLEPAEWTSHTLAPKERGCFVLKANVLSGADTGRYQLSFMLYYKKEGANTQYINATVKVWVEIAEKATPQPTAEPVIDGGGGGSSFKNKPKVIIDSYSFSADKIFAGDTFDLGMVLRNTSAKEAVKNMEVTVTNEAGVIIPASGSGNSAYVDELDKDSKCTRVFSFQVTPEAEAKGQLLSVEITYDGTKNRQEFTTKTSVTVPVQQKIRVRCDNPVIYDEAWEGQSVNMSVQMFNLGKSTLYNCMVEVQGQGLSLEESYYGGNIASGGTMRADLVLNTAVAGEIDGTARIIYEDVFGDPYEQLLPFHVSVSKDAPMMMTVSGGDAMPAGAEAEPQTAGAGAGLGWLMWVLGVGAAGTLTGLLIVRAKKRRARELEDL